MKTFWRMIVGAGWGIVLLARPALAAEEEPPLAVFDFEQDVAGWGSVDQSPVVRVEDETGEHVKVGRGALQFSYTVPTAKQIEGQEKPPPVLLGQLQVDLRDTRSLRFWLKTSQSGPLVVVLMERDGSSYHAALYSPAETWQPVFLSLDRFQLGDDSFDENGRLDAGQIQGVGFLDVSFFLAAMMNQPVPKRERKLWLDELEFRADEAPSAYRIQDRDGVETLVLDNFDAGYSAWIPMMGEARLSDEVPEAEKGGQSLHWQYRTGPNLPSFLMRPMDAPPLAEPLTIRLWVKSSAPTTLLLQLEESADARGQKSGYHHTFPIPVANQWQEVELDLAEFKLGDDKVDENHQLDFKEVETILLVDVAAMTGQAGANELWLDQVVME